MRSLRRSEVSARSVPCLFLFILVCCLLIASGCSSSTEVDDPQLKPIQEMLNKSVPAGTSEALVSQFLSARGYPLGENSRPGTLIAIIRHIDTQKLEPVTARVTFYFDANGKLNTTEIVRTFNQPIPQAQQPTHDSQEQEQSQPSQQQQQ